MVERKDVTKSKTMCTEWQLDLKSICKKIIIRDKNKRKWEAFAEFCRKVIKRMTEDEIEKERMTRRIAQTHCD